MNPFSFKKNWVIQLSWEKDGVFKTHVFNIKLCPKWTFQLLKSSPIAYNYPKVK